MDDTAQSGAIAQKTDVSKYLKILSGSCCKVYYSAAHCCITCALSSPADG